MDINIGIAEEDRKAIAESLSKVLAVSMSYRLTADGTFLTACDDKQARRFRIASADPVKTFAHPEEKLKLRA